MEFFLPRGEQVWVKVLEVRQEGPGPQGIKLAASMRAVSQEDGRDLDPDNALAMAGELWGCHKAARPGELDLEAWASCCLPAAAAMADAAGASRSASCMLCCAVLCRAAMCVVRDAVQAAAAPAAAAVPTVAAGGTATSRLSCTPSTGQAS